jgi:hypothetical protein
MLGWADEDGAGNKLTADNFDPRRVELVTYDEKFTDIIPVWWWKGMERTTTAIS